MSAGGATAEAYGSSDTATTEAQLSPAASALASRLAAGDARLAVIGLGFVGTPVAALFADSGLDVVGVDVDEAKVRAMSEGRVPFAGEEPGLAELLARVVAAGQLSATDDYDDIAGADVALVAVETPVESATHRPRYVALRSALAALGPQLHRGVMVIVESTLAPGTMRDIVAPTLEASSGLRVGEDLLLVHCPERVMPGRLLQNLRTMSRVIGGVTPEAATVAKALYSRIVQAELDTADALTAELVKTGENAYRDVQIAFANELALICDALGADVYRVRELITKSPGRHMLMPGAGVGGHCIPKDPWLLVANAREVDGFKARLIPAARTVNDGMPGHVADLLQKELAKQGRKVEDAVVVVLGWSYLEDSDDERNAPSAALATLLQGQVAELRIHDPWVTAHANSSVETLADGADAIVIMVAHSAYRELNWPALHDRMRTPTLIDGRRVVDAATLERAGWRVRTVGVGQRGGVRDDGGDRDDRGVRDDRGSHDDRALRDDHGSRDDGEEEPGPPGRGR